MLLLLSHTQKQAWYDECKALQHDCADGSFIFYQLNSQSKTLLDICTVEGILSALDAGELQVAFGKVRIGSAAVGVWGGGWSCC